MALKVVDRFTTQDGEWYPSGKPYSVRYEMINKYAYYGPRDAKGGATHVYVAAPVGSLVTIVTQDGAHRHSEHVDASKLWVNMPMHKGSAYNPDRGQRGWWKVLVDGVEVADNIGLPYSWHVSTFIVVKDVPDVVKPPPAIIPLKPVPYKRRDYQMIVRTFEDGVLVGEEIRWQS